MKKKILICSLVSILFLTFFLKSAIVVAQTPESSGCTKDTDCKGDRVCVNGKCQEAVSSTTVSEGKEKIGASEQASATLSKEQITHRINIYSNMARKGKILTIIGLVFFPVGVGLTAGGSLFIVDYYDSCDYDSCSTSDLAIGSSMLVLGPLLSLTGIPLIIAGAVLWSTGKRKKSQYQQMTSWEILPLFGYDKVTKTNYYGLQFSF